MTNVLNPEIQTHEATVGRFFNTFPVPTDAFGIVERFEEIAQMSADARAQLELYTPEQLEEYSKTMSRGKMPDDEVTKKRVTTIDQLILKANALQDAASVVEKEGSKAADYFVENNSFGIKVIGEHVYWIHQGEDRTYLCVSDEENQLAVYFNRVEQFSEPGARSAGLQDYLNLIRDLKPAE